LAVPDPYYKELPAYAQVLQMVEKSITGLLSQLSTSQSNS
jgi:protein-tyrosine-phosphatase